MDYNYVMRIDELREKNILLFGKSRALTAEEFSAQLKIHDISALSFYDDSVDLIIEGRMINPVEQDEIDMLYERRAAPIITIDTLEQALCESIDSARLLMSLKLSGDKERLLGYLQNRFIDNRLFLRLLALYDWQGEGFFENDVNRDVTAALIKRFYENIERNHNVEYANMGLMHLIAQTDDAELIETIAMLAPLQEGLKNGCDHSTHKILTAIAEKSATPERVLKQYVRLGDVQLKQIIALRGDISSQLQQVLLDSGDEDIFEALSYNSSLDTASALSMLDAYGANIASYIRLNDALFTRMLDRFPEALARNSSLDIAMQEALLAKTLDVSRALASNERLDEVIQRKLYETGDTATIDALAANESVTPGLLAEIALSETYDEALATNAKTPVDILKRLFKTGRPAVMTALAQNRATPTDLLYQLQIDQRYARYVMENPGFGEHIQKENIGWLV